MLINFDFHGELFFEFTPHVGDESTPVPATDAGVSVQLSVRHDGHHDRLHTIQLDEDQLKNLELFEEVADVLPEHLDSDGGAGRS